MVTETGSGDDVDYLDLNIRLREGVLTWGLFTKPGKAFQFPHFCSAQPDSTFQSIVSGERVRFERRHSCKMEARKALCWLSRRFAARGYPDRLLMERLFGPKRPKQRKVIRSFGASLKVPYHPCIDWCAFRKCINSAPGSLKAVLGNRAIRITTVAPPNCFRRLYKEVWHSPFPET